MTAKFNPQLFHTEQSLDAEEFARLLANSDNYKQAAVFAWFADAIVKWPIDWSWPEQCKQIAEQMDSPEECRVVANLLETLVISLRAMQPAPVGGER